MNPYPVEVLDPDNEDNGTMPDDVMALSDAVVGHRIVSVEQNNGNGIITLDNDKRVKLTETDDCCAYTELDAFLLHPEMVQHVITGVGTTERYNVWHIFADAGDVLALTVGWSCGNPFYYAYGFHITVEDL